ncbi:hypothetical protein DESC_370109 [Desulfosarcina cetonica]|nr:hypothetical protein DESC_370109 [Desulfosarcina cetonica]
MKVVVLVRFSYNFLFFNDFLLFLNKTIDNATLSGRVTINSL